MASQLRVLLLEDDPEDAERALAALRALPSFSTEVHWERTLDAGIEALRGDRFDVALVDRRLGGLDAIDRLGQAETRAPGTPLILVTGFADPMVDAAAADAGFADLIEKQRLQPAVVERSIRYALERARTEAALRDAAQVREQLLVRQFEAYELLRALVQSSSELVLVVDSAGRIGQVGPSVQSLLGCPPHRVEGRALHELTHPADAGALTRALAATGPTATNLRLRSDREGWRDFEVTFTDRLELPSLRGILVKARDVTESRRTEALLRESQEQLSRAQRLEAIGRLAGAVAHDFANILTVIRSFSEVLIEDCVEEGRSTEEVNEIALAASRGESLVRQLLAFSRRDVAAPKPVSLTEIVGGMAGMVRRLVGEDIDLVMSAGEVGPIHADPGQLEQIVMNLVVNARDAIAGRGRVAVRVEEVPSGNPAAAPTLGTVVLTVSDTGEGIDPDALPRIFEPFFSTKGTGRGTGIGLSTVQALTERMGGRIEVESVVGHGTTFRVSFPRAAKSTEREAGEVPSRREQIRPVGIVLVVEDDEPVRSAMRKALERRGHTVLEAADGALAIELLREHGPVVDVVVSDMILPTLGGLELADQLRALGLRPATVFTSGYPPDEIRIGGALPPGVTFLPKPFSGEQLADAISQALSRRAA